MIHGLKCGSKYQVYIMAFNEIGNSDASDSLAFTTDGGGECKHWHSLHSRQRRVLPATQVDASLLQLISRSDAGRKEGRKEGAEWSE